MDDDMSQSDTHPVPLALSQVEQGAGLLARVFQLDPAMQYIMGDRASMSDKSVRFYRASIRMGLLYGEVYTTPSMDGVVVWISPENFDLTFRQVLRTGFLTAMLSMGLKPMMRIMRSMNYGEKLAKQVISGPHWELGVIGVEPSQQGKGIGATLIQPILDRADAENVPCFLVSGNERNLTFYKRHGFEIAAQGQTLKTGPEIWVMLREPNR